MKFVSITDDSDRVDFKTALFSGLAKNSSLYWPSTIQKFTKTELDYLHGQELTEIATEVLWKFLSEDFSKDELAAISRDALDFPIPLRIVGSKQILELFHGPTMAFKDVAARFLARFFERYAKENEPITVLVATSGDTGGAVAHAFGEMKNVRVVILFPKNGVSELQKEQLTKVAPNITSIELDGSFDQCQAFVKQALRDDKISAKLSSANSINIGRLLPQVIYYVYAYLLCGPYHAVIPTGNIGNATAGLIARSMGAGPETITLAINSNTTLKDYSTTGLYKPRTSKATLSNAMDVGNPNNFPRFIHGLNNSFRDFSKLVNVESVSDEETIATQQSVWRAHRYLLDPHTAVGWAASEHETEHSLNPVVVVGTASPEKFRLEIKNAADIEVPTGKAVGSFYESRYLKLPADYEDIKRAIETL